MNRRVKIGVVSDFRWQVHLGRRLGDQQRRRFFVGSLGQEILLESFSNSGPDRAAHRHEVVQNWLLESSWQGGVDPGPDGLIDSGQILLEFYENSITVIYRGYARQ